jgi:hypothetical protein
MYSLLHPGIDMDLWAIASAIWTLAHKDIVNFI